MKIGFAQLNFKVGDIAGNEKLILSTMDDAEKLMVDLLIFPELAISGYPPEDLLLRSDFILDGLRASQRIAARSGNVTSVVGLPLPTLGSPYTIDAEGRTAYNAAIVVNDGKTIGTYEKRLLPNYGVFDEARYFVPGKFHPDTYAGDLFKVKGVKVGVLICEDLWRPELAEKLAEQGAELLVVINASPFHHGKYADRVKLVSKTAVNTGCDIAYVNLIGGQDELVFDGGSMYVDKQGTLVHELPRFEDAFQVVDTATLTSAPVALFSRPEKEIYEALKLGLRDYVEKNRFSHVTIGLSGGIDSALTAAIAVDALGSHRVRGVTLPGPYSSKGSVDDSLALAKNLGFKCEVITIDPIFDSAMSALEENKIPTEGVVSENLQARIRGLLIMAMSNGAKGIVLTTGNKSEMAVGYATLYGDMAGGYSVLKDVPKTMVYKLAGYANMPRVRIPVNTIDKPPSAELAPDQLDSNSLPEYDILDNILERYVELNQSPADIIRETKYDPSVVYKVVRMVDMNEYKRRQSAPGVKITTRAFGRDRRLPITNGWGV